MPKLPHLPILPLLAAALAFIALAPRLSAMPIQWSDAGEGVNPCGNVSMHDGKLYIVNVDNWGICDADNMVELRVSAVSGQPLQIDYAYISCPATGGGYLAQACTLERLILTSWQHGFCIAAGNSYSVHIRLQPGCDPGRLRLSAMSAGGTLFNMFDEDGNYDPINGTEYPLIIGPPYAPPSLALARQAPPGPGTNAVALALTSDAEFLQLQYRDTLAPTNWTDLARVAVTGAVTVATDTNAAPTRFYRTVVP